jgi:hypothetical protein
LIQELHNHASSAASHPPSEGVQNLNPICGRCCCCFRFKELRDYVLARRDALGGGPKGPGKQPSIMDLDLDDATALKKSGKGFA